MNLLEDNLVPHGIIPEDAFLQLHLLPFQGEFQHIFLHLGLCKWGIDLNVFSQRKNCSSTVRNTPLQNSHLRQVGTDLSLWPWCCRRFCWADEVQWEKSSVSKLACRPLATLYCLDRSRYIHREPAAYLPQPWIQRSAYYLKLNSKYSGKFNLRTLNIYDDMRERVGRG